MNAKVREKLPIVEDVLDEQEAFLSLDLTGYKNHVYRMINFCFALEDLSQVEEEKVIVAGCFHDLGIWTANTFDYLSPSADAASEYLEKTGWSAWNEHINLMISEHHKLGRFEGDRVTEIFRKGDLVDLSIGAIRFGIDPVFVRDVKARFPNCGFHRSLLHTAARWIIRHPLNPLPVARL